MKGQPITVTLADGMDASVDGRGWGAEHEDAKNLANAAPEMLDALEDALKLIHVARQHFPKSLRDHDKFQLELTCATIGSAIFKAKGGRK